MTHRPISIRRIGLLSALSALLVSAAAVVVAPAETRAPVSTASRADCIPSKQVCAKVAGHRRSRLTLVLRTRHAKKGNYAICVTTSRHPSAWAARRKFRAGSESASRRDERAAHHRSICQSFRLSRGERNAKFDRVEDVYRSRVAYRRIYSYTGPGRYIACWTWADSCARDGRKRLAKIIFWIKRSGRVIVRRPQ